MLYANENRKTMAQRYPADSNKEISKKLGSTWKNLDADEKRRYFEKAREIDLEHKRKYPGKWLILESTLHFQKIYNHNENPKKTKFSLEEEAGKEWKKACNSLNLIMLSLTICFLQIANDWKKIFR